MVNEHHEMAAAPPPEGAAPPSGLAMLEQLPDPILLIEPATYRLVYSNAAARRLYGEPGAGRHTCYALSHGRETPCDGPDHECPLDAVLATGAAREVEHFHLDRHGERRLFRVQASPMADDSGGTRWVLETHADITEQQTELALLSSAFHTAQPMLIADAQLRISQVNEAFREQVGWTEGEMQGSSLRSLPVRWEVGGDLRGVLRELRRQGAWQGAVRLRDRSGHEGSWWGWISAVPGGESRVSAYVVALNSLEEIRAARGRAQQYFEVARVMMAVLDADGRVREINQRGADLLGLPREEIVGADWFERFVPPDSRKAVRGVFDALLGGEWQPAEYGENELLTGSGQRRLFAFRNTVLRDEDGRIEGALFSGEDITEQRRFQEELQRLADHDGLTGLYNRRAFETLLEREMGRSRRHGRPLSLVMFDIDHFKPVNDVYGHLLGDDILKEVAELVTARLREEDVAGRWGGEGFMVLLPDTTGDGAQGLAEGLREEVADADFPGPGRVTISLGVVELRGGDELKDLTRRVDDALYAAKTTGRNRTCGDGGG